MAVSSVIEMKKREMTKVMSSSGDLKIDLRYTPLEKQKELHNNETEIVLYGGAVGGGKSAALVIDVFLYAIKYSEVNCALFRKTRPSAKKVLLIGGFEKFIPSELWHWNERDSCVQLINGSRIYLLSMNDDREKAKVQGEAWSYLGIDEVTLFQPEQIEFLSSRCRSAALQDGTRPPRRVRYTANPGGPSHAYIKRLFLDRDFAEFEDAELYDFIPSNIYDNKYIMADEGYRKSLEAMPEQMKKRYLLGDWSAMDGVFLDTFRQDICSCVPFNIPRSWRRYRAIDYGWSDPTVVGWFAVSPAGTHYLYREFVCAKTPAKEISKRIIELSRYQTSDGKDDGPEQILSTFGDPSIFYESGISSDPRERSPGMIFEQNGLRVTPANNDRKFGGMVVREYLTPMETLINKEGDIDLRSKLVIFNTAKYTLDTIPFLICKPSDPDDIENGSGKKQRDHCLIGETLIQTPNGSIPIKDIESGNMVNTLLGSKPVFKKWSNGTKKVFDFTIRLGAINAEVTATPNHKILTTKGCKRLDQLEKNDKVFIPRNIASLHTETTEDSSIEVRLKSLGIERTIRKEVLKTLITESEFVNSVIKNISERPLSADSAQIIASLNGGEHLESITKKEFAKVAGKFLLATNTPEQELVAVSVESVSQKNEREEEVFNLTVLGSHTIIVNDSLLLSQSYDMIRYYLVSQGNYNTVYGEELFDAFEQQRAQDKRMIDYDKIMETIGNRKKEGILTIDDLLSKLKEERNQVAQTKESFKKYYNL